MADLPSETALIELKQISLASLYKGHFIKTLNSSSTLLQVSQSRSSTGTLLTPYLPVSIFKGATPHLNLAYADLYFFSTIMLKYVEHSIYTVRNVENVEMPLKYSLNL